MKRTLATILSLTLIIGLMGVMPAMAEETASPVAYIMYADSNWANCFWMDGNEYPVKATTAEITGAGQYTVGLEFNEEAAGLAFTALGIKNGENALSGYTVEIKAMRVNGEEIAFEKGYTSSDDGVETRMNIYNEWVSELPKDARSFDGKTDDAKPIIVDKELFASVKSFEIDFVLHQFGVDTAYIMFADSSWANCFWMDGNEYPVQAATAVIDGFGDYTVGLEFNEPAQGLAFTALGIVNGEKTYPGAYIKINAIRLNGEEIAFEKGYTSSDNGIETRMNIYNEWVSEVPADARSYDGKTDDAKPVIVDKELFASVKSFEIDFSLLPVTDVAYIMYADGSWANCFWMDGNEYPVKAATAEITGAGTYTVGLEFNEEAQGLAFTALGIVNGEKTFNGYFIDITEIKVNGEPIEIGKGYTSSDNGVETRENIYNEWVSELPTDARRADGDLEGASPIIVNKDAFAAVKTVEITFNFIYGKPIVKDESAPLTQEEADALKKDAVFNAYIGVQGKDTYVFRNSWEEANYGRDSQDHPDFFGRLTGWDADNNAVDYGGAFVDAEITGNGDYAVSLTTGDMGMGETKDYNMLFVSTDIPAALVRDGFLIIDNVKVKFGSGATQEYTEVTSDGEYAAIKIIDVYNQANAPAIVYSVPGPNETVTISFTVSGW
ncbi:MAG: hypothetical protein IKH30_12650 [Clostridia bacterium]|nr:hypothetical protein [Clostridia bacterium]MBR4537468.1 hypothetical protein [Clostridia bacterium]